jgi:hypothetical protein
VQTPDHSALLSLWRPADAVLTALLGDASGACAPYSTVESLRATYLRSFVAWWHGEPAPDGTVDEHFERALGCDPRIALARVEAAADSPVEMLLTLRAALDFRAGARIEAAWPADELEEALRGLVVHAVPRDRLLTVLQSGELLPRRRQRLAEQGGLAPGRRLLLDPALFEELVFFGPSHPRYVGGERAANAHRTGRTELGADYLPAARFAYDERTLRSLPGHLDLGLPRVTVRGAVPLALARFVCIPCPALHAQAVRQLRAHGSDLVERLVLVPADRPTTAAAYVCACNRAVAQSLGSGRHRLRDQAAGVQETPP